MELKQIEFGSDYLELSLFVKLRTWEFIQAPLLATKPLDFLTYLSQQFK
jgi:hypothetical protein